MILSNLPSKTLGFRSLVLHLEVIIHAYIRAVASTRHDLKIPRDIDYSGDLSSGLKVDAPRY